MPYQGLSLDMAAYMLNLNIVMGEKERVMDILLGKGGREGGREGGEVREGGRKEGEGGRRGRGGFGLVPRPHPEGKGSGRFRHIFWDCT